MYFDITEELYINWQCQVRINKRPWKVKKCIQLIHLFCGGRKYLLIQNQPKSWEFGFGSLNWIYNGIHGIYVWEISRNSWGCLSCDAFKCTRYWMRREHKRAGKVIHAKLSISDQPWDKSAECWKKGAMSEMGQHTRLAIHEQMSYKTSKATGGLGDGVI